jgi:hypothetical protein
MFFDRATFRHPSRAALAGALAALIVSTAFALAQEPPAASPEQQGFLAAIDRWFSEQAGNLAATFKGANKQFEDFGDKANDAARTTYKGAQDTAAAVTRIPGTRVVTGHARCQIAPNGAPDCLAAADTVCKAKGFDSGKSLDMTTSEICPVEVYLAGRRTGPDCHTETFVSRALCQ